MKHMVLWTLLFMAFHAIAQTPTIQIQVSSSNLRAGQPFTIRYTVSGNSKASVVEDPSCDGFDMASAGQSSSSSVSIINGKMTSSAKIILDYRCTPLKSGTFTVNPIKVKVGSSVVSSNSLNVTIGEGSADDIKKLKTSNFVAKTSLSKPEVYVGEFLSVRTSLIRNPQLNILQFNHTGLSFPQELIVEDTKEYEKEGYVDYNGLNYYENGIGEYIVRPNSVGDVEIDPTTLELTYLTEYNQYANQSVKGNVGKLKVKPLPTGAPKSFDNQIGTNYKLEVIYSTNDLKAGDALEVHVKVSGTGNLNLITPPALTFPSDFDTYDPETKNQYKLTSNGYSGSREFHYLLIPRHHGTYEIPGLKMAYFDLASGSYKELSADPQTVTVQKNGNSTPATTNPSVTKQEEVEVMNNEIRHIVYDTALQPSGISFYGSGKFWLSLTSPFLLTLGLFLFMGRKKDEEESEVQVKKNASKDAIKALKSAELKLQERDDNGFYEELYKGMMNFISKKLDVPLSQLTKESLHGKIGDETISVPLVQILEECEMARFAPITHSGAMDTMDKARSIIQKIDKYAS